jgi:hypothetical protein
MPDKSEDESEKPTSIYLGREEIRGLFTLGLLAVVTAVRIQYMVLNREITILINGQPQIITPFFDAMIILWSLYAFFMVLGISDDMIGEKGCIILRRISRYYLYISYLILGLIAVAFYHSIYPLQATGLFVFVVALAIYWVVRQMYFLIKRIGEKGLSIKSLQERLVNYLKSEWHQVFLGVFLGCLLLTLFGTHNELTIPSSIVGSSSLILFLVLRERMMQKRKKLGKD